MSNVPISYCGAVALLCMGETATAQSAPRGVTVGFGAGRAIGVATDDSVPKTVFAGMARFAVSPRVAIEVEVAHFGSETADRSGPGVFSSFQNNVTIILGRYGDTIARHSDSTWTTE